jgi:hypothetical protein
LTVELDTALVKCFGLGRLAVSAVRALLFLRRKKPSATRMIDASGSETPNPMASLAFELNPDEEDDDATDPDGEGDSTVTEEDVAGGTMSSAEKSLLR